MYLIEYHYDKNVGGIARGEPFFLFSRLIFPSGAAESSDKTRGDSARRPTREYFVIFCSTFHNNKSEFNVEKRTAEENQERGGFFFVFF